MTEPYHFPPPDMVVRAVAERMYVPVDDIKGGRRGPQSMSIRNARAACVYIGARRGYQPAQFARLMGLRDKSSTIYPGWVKRVEGNEALRSAAEMCIARCDGEAHRQDAMVNCD